MRLFLFLFSWACTFFSGVILSDTKRFKLRTYQFSSGKVRRDVRFVVLSDLHGREFGRGNKKLLRSIRDLNPDFVLMVGDIMTAKDRGQEIITNSVEVACRLVQDISAFCPVYYSLGNHESRVQWDPWKYDFTFLDMIERLKKAGAHVLDNQSAYVKEYGIRIHGLSLPETYYKMSRLQKFKPEQLKKRFGKTDDGRYHILLAHDPEYLPVYAKWGPDLSFSGHYHGGIMRLPKLGGVISPKLHLFPKFDGGLYHLEGKNQIVSCGIGTHTLPIRVFNPAELLLVEVKKG